MNGRARRAQTADGAIAVETDRGMISAPLVVDALGWRRMLATGDGYQPPDAPLSRGLEVHPGGAVRGPGDLDRPQATSPPATAGRFPADDELRIGIGSFDPRFHVKDTTVELTRGPRQGAERVPGQLDPPQAAARRPRAASSSSATRPATACRSAPRGSAPRSTSGSRWGASCAASSRGGRTASRRPRRYAAFHDSHEWKFQWMLRVQKLIPRVPPRLLGAG